MIDGLTGQIGIVIDCTICANKTIQEEISITAQSYQCAAYHISLPLTGQPGSIVSSTQHATSIYTINII